MKKIGTLTKYPKTFEATKKKIACGHQSDDDDQKLIGIFKKITCTYGVHLANAIQNIV